MTIKSTVLTTSPGNVFVASGQQVVTVIYLCNTSTTDTAGVSLNLIGGPGNALPGNNNAIYANVAVTPEDTYVISTEKLVLDDNNYISGIANVANVITVTVSSIAV